MKLNTKKSYLLWGALAPICSAIALVSESTKGIPVHGLVYIYVYCMARVNDILNSVEGVCVAAVRHRDAEEEGLTANHLSSGILLPAGIKLLCLAGAVES